MRIIFSFLFLILFPFTVSAETLFVGSEEEYALLPYASLYIDQTQMMDLEAVQKEVWKSVEVSELVFTVSETAHWLRYEIENNTTVSKAYYLEYDVSIINFLDVYVLQKGVVLQCYLSGAYRPLKNRALVYHSYLFPVTLEPGERKEVYVRLKHLFSAIPANMVFKEQTTLLLENYAENVLEGVFFGVMIVMFFYNLILYLMTRYRPYIAYVLYIGTFGTWISLRMGYGMYLFDFMSVEVYRYFEISISILFTVFIIWFITGVLELKKVMPKAYLTLNIISALFVLSWVSICLMLAMEIYGYFKYPSDLFFVNFLAMNFTIVLTAAILTYRGNRTALFILLAWMLFISSMIILTLSLTDVIPHYEWIMPYMQLTMVIEMVMLSLILGDRYRQQEKLLHQQTRLAAMGSMIENIAHQWRQPLSEINADLLALEMYMDDDDKVSVKKRIELIEEKTQIMSETINDFQNFYNFDKPKERFELGQLLEKALHLSEDRFAKHKVECKIDVKESLALYGVENEYLQVVMAILNNAVDALKNRERDNRKIMIIVAKEGLNAVVNIKNNGDKIDEKVLPKLFQPYFTTKNSNTQNGIGLFMSRKIIEESFHGTLEIANAQEGVFVQIKAAYV